MDYGTYQRKFRIQDLTRVDYVWARDYVRSRVRPNIHFLLTEYELRLLMLKLMDYEGLLDETSSRILRTPYFGKAYVAEKGNINKVVGRLFVDALPGAVLIRLA